MIQESQTEKTLRGVRAACIVPEEIPLFDDFERVELLILGSPRYRNTAQQAIG